MPPSSDQGAYNQDLLNLNSLQEESSRKRSPGRKSQVKSRRKYDPSGESVEKKGIYKTEIQDL